MKTEGIFFMKFKLLSLFALSFFTISSGRLQSCPLCIGTISKDSPPFFSDEFYKAYQATDLVVDFITTITK